MSSNHPVTDGPSPQTNISENASETSEKLTLQQLIVQYQIIRKVVNNRWPIENHDQRVLARTLKMMEELGELSDEILSSMQLQRQSKISQFDKQNLADEFADVLACVILLGIELGIDIEEVIQRKISFTHERLADELAGPKKHH